ncbi:ADP-ribosylglycohydrolase family protein [Tessaracoccus sp.]|uniref:ADP-ribosylglycohydrolase family protein n=1 Tax=Tessaracoccus sp. TaxID=1971211 RepID=UPI002637281D|nr:ADP-ribosylglycohydrolase family protein [Tessaracoccus sp.]
MTLPPRLELAEAYQNSRFDALRPADLVADEIQQLRETGHDVEGFVRSANDTDPGDRGALLTLVDEMAGAARTKSWEYEEPDALEDILASAGDPAPAEQVSEAVVADGIRAAWYGRIAGCNLGKPIEFGWTWTPERIREYLELADAYPLADYVPRLDPMPDGFELVDNWPETTRGNVAGSARDDDIDYTILGLHLLERHGPALATDDVARAWTTLFPLEQVYTAERAAYINIVDGFRAPETARRRNPYREWIGAQIRADIFGYVHPGDVVSAARLAYRDAALSHTGNGIYGEMWAAALVAGAFTASTAREAVDLSLTVVPRRSRLADAVTFVTELRDAGVSWQAAVSEIREQFAVYSWVHTINNAAAVVAALLWGEDDWTTATTRVVMTGWDTDSNGATVGSVAAILAGSPGLPARFIDPLQDRTRSALFGFDNSSISDLAARTIRVASDFNR